MSWSWLLHPPTGIPNLRHDILHRFAIAAPRVVLGCGVAADFMGPNCFATFRYKSACAKPSSLSGKSYSAAGLKAFRHRTLQSHTHHPILLNTVNILMESVVRPPCRYVTEKDLAFFQYHAEQSGPCDGASRWELMMNKEIPNCVKYKAWRRTLPNGKTEYKSITTAADATAQEVMDAYLDDPNRALWVSGCTQHVRLA